MPIVTKQRPVVSSTSIGFLPLEVRKPVKVEEVELLPAEPEEGGIKLNVYGKSGTGKTTFWATFPRPIGVAVCSGGVKSGELRSLEDDLDGIYSLKMEESGQLYRMVEQMEKGGFKTLVLDHLSGLQDLVLKEITGLDEIPLYKIRGDKARQGTATQGQYGDTINNCKDLLRCLLNTPLNVVIVAQERAFNNEGADSEVMLPSVCAGVMPKLAEWLNPAVDYIVQTFIREKVVEEKKPIPGAKGKFMTLRKKTGGVEFCIRTGHHPVYTTKFRVPRHFKIPQVIVDPTYEKVLDLIKGRKGAG